MRLSTARTTRVLKVVAMAGVVCGAACAVPASAQNAPRCERVTSAPSAPETPAATVSQLSDVTFSFKRGDKRGPSDRTKNLDATPPLPPDAKVYAEVAGDLEDSDGEDSFPEEGIVVRPVVAGSGNLKLKVCIDPERPEVVETGRYVGSVKIFGPNVQATAATIEITLRASQHLAIGLLLLGCVLGALAKANADRKATEETLKAANDSSVRFRWGDYFASTEFLGGVLAGLFAAALAYAQIYLADPDWGEPLDKMTLVFAGIASMVSGKTLVDWAKPYVPKS